MFHPIIQQWFTEKYGEATEIQDKAWPLIARGKHLLITAPTGSGKTLTAFLWAINCFVTGKLETGSTRILYISPLKALNSDIRRNLLEPLAELRTRSEKAGEAFPDIRVDTRSGDTDSAHRRRMLKNPPEILITTPESLNLLLSSQSGRSILYDINTVILDEIHAVVDSKRGVYLMSAIERLVPLSGEFQRIAVSATINPLETVASYVGGYERDGDAFSAREVDILTSSTHKHYDISIVYPEAAATRGEDEKVWDYLAEDLLPRIHQNNSTLVFVNSRALCEKLTFKINNAAGGLIAYAHHGSLSREIRTDVEARLKSGQLQAIVATSSLEMGIDIGALDEVILVQSPGSIASSIQRIGRAGHQVGAPSRCAIYPTHPRDFLDAAVLSKAVVEKSLEPVKTITSPLDVLGQVIISMTGTENWDIDELYAELRRSTPFHTLGRREFDLVINMLLGRYADHHIRELRPRVRVDRTNNRIEARKGSLMSLYLSGGVIPDRGYFQLRHEGDNARIGELDEEFVWEANIGQVFSLGTQIWQVKKITHNDVIVGPGKATGSAPPFWKSEPLNRSFHYAERVNNFLEAANSQLETPDFSQRLVEEHGADERVADEVVRLLQKQKEHCRRDLPHRHHLLFEHVRSGPARATGHQLVLHTGWGAMVNRPLAMALESAWQDNWQEQPEVFVANDSIVVQLSHELSANELIAMVPPDQLEILLRQRLEGSGFFGARFRENAGRSLLLSKGRFNERKPLWMSRLQSQKLMDAVLKYEDFPILLETWRTCLQDEFDMDNLKAMLAEVASGEITVSEVETSTPSPFAHSVAWDQINTYMYMSDTPRSGKQSKLSDDLLKEVVFSPGLRPQVSSHLSREFEQQRQRMIEGWLPADEEDLEDWVKERCLIPVTEWQALINLLGFTSDRVRLICNAQLVASDDDADSFQHLLTHTDDPDSREQLESLLANWLQYYGPVSLKRIQSLLPVEPGELLSCLLSLTESGALIDGNLLIDDEPLYYCDADNFEYLLRIQRATRRSTVEAKPVEALASFMFNWQTRTTAADHLDQLFECLERLRGLPLPASLWESDVLPCRLKHYRTESLDALFQEGEFSWLGLGDKQVAFCLDEDIDLVSNQEKPSGLISQERVRMEYTAIQDETGMSSSELTEALWQEVWQSRITNDSFLALRRGIETGFRPPDEMRNVSPTRRRRAFREWRTRSPMVGNWYQLPVCRPAGEIDALEQQEIEKERARLMMNRYGIVFRELCQRESTRIEWHNIFRALRLMELSGEVVSGHFFSGIPGPQFVTAESLRTFHEDRSDFIFFLNAADPVSPSGLGLGVHADQLPRHVASNYLVYHGDRLVLTVARRGRDLNFLVEANDESMDRYLDVLGHLLYRAFDPMKQLTIEKINGEPASSSRYQAALERVFNLYTDYKSVIIQREL